ncbi:MAG: J domain-containing protein, partial [Acetatifactor sp.]|nr:J domain-containing protein [Acetatifactor sp.]
MPPVSGTRESVIAAVRENPSHGAAAQERILCIMDEKWIFAVLGIERTKDQEEIRGAYRRLLQQVNPEDDPEGFKRLREAYEAALK